MFILLLHYVQPLTAIEAHLEEHRRLLDRHYAAGHFLASGPQVPCTGGVILAKGLSREELDGVLAEDPFYRERLATYQSSNSIRPSSEWVSRPFWGRVEGRIVPRRIARAIRGPSSKRELEFCATGSAPSENV
jgi:uncharacterized protein YciI